MNAPLSWDEFRLVKAIADARSLVGAAEALGLNHSTIFRRLGSVEKTLGARLFERSRSGYQPTAAGEEMVALATGMSESVVEFERRVAGLDIILASHQLNLSRRDADVAIRATNEPPETLVGRRIGPIRWAIYASPKLALEFGSRAMEEAPWVGFGDNLGSQIGKRWTERHINQRRQVFRVNSVLSMAESIAAGAGAGVLPCFIGNGRTDLERLGGPIPELDVGLWILTHPDLRHSARVRAFTDFVGGELAKLRKVLEGA
jgi:DNA-binding transcriptional LysR family regulator